MRDRTIVCVLFAMYLAGTLSAKVWHIPPDYIPEDYEDPEIMREAGLKWYRIAIDPNGEMGWCDGDGYEGQWYYYPETGWWRMWFYNGAHDEDRFGEVDYHVYVKSFDRAFQVSGEVGLSWTKAEWSEGELDHPPLPEDAPDLESETLYMSYRKLLGVAGYIGTRETEGMYRIDSHNPEWIAVTVKGTNTYVFRGIAHRCLAEDPEAGACCNESTGDCSTTTQGNCEAPYTWLGTGSSCSQCIPPPVELDFGDAPDPTYPTSLAKNGARHVISGTVFLGAGVDAEPDGLPDRTSTGDDLDGTLDEDGVVFTSDMKPGELVTLEVTAGASGKLNAWIDFDQDGSFGGDNEQIFKDAQLGFGVNGLGFEVPLDAAVGLTYARFRFNTSGGLTYKGKALDGEVEDYAVSIDERITLPPVALGQQSKWSQPPAATDAGNPFLINGWGESSGLMLHHVAADDWLCESPGPVAGITWWGIYDGWTYTNVPSHQPVGFQIGLWTDAPQTEPEDPDAFNHPDELIWQTYCTHWTWNLAGTSDDPRDLTDGQSCFQFTHMLSQDEWPHLPCETDTPQVYWISIAAVYDPEGPEPLHRWSWLTRPAMGGSAAVVIDHVRTPEDPVSGQTQPTWPAAIGDRWESGHPIESATGDPWDLTFELVARGATPAPPVPLLPGDVNFDGVVDFNDVAIVVNHWLESR